MKKSSLWLIALVILTVVLVAGCGSKSDEKVTYRVGTDPTWPPFQMIDENTKEITGFETDLVKEIAALSGFDVEFVNVTFDALIPGIASCQYDFAASTITITEARKKNMLFTDPLVQIGQIMTVAEGSDLVNKEDFAGKVIGGQTGTTGAIMAQEWADEGLVTYRGYETVDLAFLDVKNGQLDGVLSDNTMADSYVASLGGLKTVGDLYSSEEIGIAVCKNKADLLDQINTAIKTLKDNGKFDELYKKYFAAAE
mgnify:CR=1 FL=1